MMMMQTIRLGVQEGELLCRAITDREIDLAMDSIDSNKAPGLDRFDVPKVVNPAIVCQYRAIACCSTLYKIISKVLTARVQKVVGSVVSEFQAGFIPGRHIVDNVVVATELVKAYSMKHLSPRCMIKVIDLRKACDSIEWSFLEMVMQELGFPTQLLGGSWLMLPLFLLRVDDGKPSLPFDAKKGLRQGGPRSPFLFAIEMEYLSICLAPLDRGDVIYVQLLFDVFSKFSKASGLQANMNKTKIYFSSMMLLLMLCCCFAADAALSAHSHQSRINDPWLIFSEKFRKTVSSSVFVCCQIDQSILVFVHWNLWYSF
ncbi:uncharacterized protein [Spinacia oleracea]|uniref:Reverse transcriptase domain-containing protein n=1 Tax=Spinacia oleracea TaxID=3562 RepID=A0ABM3RIZ6_SPIOL|nr:uncharacterized protein LOC130470059 [Spinacia oleracea]